MQKVFKFLRISLRFVILILFLFLFQNSGCDKSVSVTPPDKPPPNGYIYIDSYPKGAHIYLNGHARRRATPDSITWLKTSVDTFTLKKELYRDTSFVVNIIEGQRLKVFIDYTKNPLMRGNIQCTSKPSKATIFINDSSTGLKTPAVIKGLLPGYYNVTYKLENHRDLTNLATVSSSNITPLYSVLVDTTIWTDYNTGNSEIPTNELSCMTIDNNDKLWIGTYHNGIIAYNGSKFSNFQKILTNLATNKINCIECVEQTNSILVGTDIGLQVVSDYGVSLVAAYGQMSSMASIGKYWISLSEESHIIFLDNYAILDTLHPTPLSSSDFNITSMAYNSSEHLWIGTKNGGVAQSIGDEWKFYNTSNSNIYSNHITALAVDHSGTVWIGYSLSDKLSYYDGTSWNFSFFTVTSDRYKVNSIYVDNRNRLWIGTDNGLLKKDGASVIFYNYDNTGLNMKNVCKAVVDQIGYVWICTYDAGLFRFRGAD